MKKVLIRLNCDAYLDRQYNKDEELIAYLHELSPRAIYLSKNGFLYDVSDYTVIKEINDENQNYNQSLVSCIGEKPSEIIIKFWGKEWLKKNL